MAPTQVLLFAFLIGFFTGLRSLTPTAVTAWAAHLGWLKVPSPLSWIGTLPAAAILTLFALVELVTDKLPKTPSRTAPPGLIARILLGGLSGACVASAGGEGRCCVGDRRYARGHIRRIPGALKTGEGTWDTRLRDCAFRRPCDDWWVAVGCFAVLNFLTN